MENQFSVAKHATQMFSLSVSTEAWYHMTSHAAFSHTVKKTFPTASGTAPHLLQTDQLSNSAVAPPNWTSNEALLKAWGGKIRACLWQDCQSEAPLLRSTYDLLKVSKVVHLLFLFLFCTRSTYMLTR